MILRCVFVYTLFILKQFRENGIKSESSVARLYFMNKLSGPRSYLPVAFTDTLSSNRPFLKIISVDQILPA